ncbi:MAG TPA: hypothetical protein VK756_06490 [Solirubrobacteraceae bacterium]|nr:hypothetical protein [Solirubrobacteraceae bacterium]
MAAAKTIVTFHPDVACDLCGRRLLRGERPDVFLGGGQRRTVCELCAPRATHEGWRREAEQQLASPLAQHPQRGRSLLGRLRQLREPVRAPQLHEPLRASDRGRGANGAESIAEPSGAQGAPRIEWAGIEREWSDTGETWGDVAGGGGAATGGAAAGGAATEGAAAESAAAESAAAEGAAAEGAAGELAGGHTTTGRGADAIDEQTAEPGYARASPAVAAPGSSLADVDTHAEVRRALEIFNAGELPRRVAGVTRSLGAACVRATPAPGVEGRVAIVVAWELCWYRYEIDLADEGAGARIAAEGMELGELAAEDRVANATADEHGMLSLLAG